MPRPIITCQHQFHSCFRLIRIYHTMSGYVMSINYHCVIPFETLGSPQTIIVSYGVAEGGLSNTTRLLGQPKDNIFFKVRQ